MLGPSFVSGGQQVFEFIKMMAYNEVYLRCAQLANASRVLGNLGDDILSKITLKSGVGTIDGDGLGRRALHDPAGPRHPEAHALPTDRPGRERRPASRVVLVVRPISRPCIIKKDGVDRAAQHGDAGGAGGAGAQEVQEAQEVSEPKRRGRPPGSKNKPKQDVPTESVPTKPAETETPNTSEPKRRGRPPGSKNKPKQDVPTKSTEVKVEPKAEPQADSPQLTREQQRSLRMLERQCAYDRLTAAASVLV